MKKILIVSTSPRRDHNSDKLCKKAAEGARRVGAEVELLHVSDYKIGPCLACNGCMKTGGKCVLRDDMAEILEKMIWADAIIMATPLYYYSLSAQMKMVIDRTYCLYNYEGGNPLVGREWYMIVTAETTVKEDLEPAVDAFRGFLRCVPDSKLVDVLYATGTSIEGKVRNAVADYDGYVNAFIKKSYTVGGVIIFPRHQGSMNQDRGTNHLISDRWDLTLECIRRHYVGEDSPLSETIERDRDFYDLFRDFRGYVDFFYLQDCVTPDYKHVIFWQSDTTFEVSNPIPKTAEEYFEWIRHSTEFIDRRAARMLDALKNDPTYHEAPPFFSESDLRMETAQNTDRYPEALDEVVGMLKCDDRIKCSTKGLRAAPSQDGYARYMNIGSLSVGIVYSKNNWRDPGSAETPFWLAIMDSEWKMTNEIRNWILGREPNLISSEWNRIPCIAVIPEIGLSFDETCVKIENDIVLLLTGALNDSTA